LVPHNILRYRRGNAQTDVVITGFFCAVAYPGIFFGGGVVSTNSVEDRKNGYLGVVDPSQGF